MSKYTPIDESVIDIISNFGFDVYQSEIGRQTYLFFTDGAKIGYLQKGVFGGIELGTVHVPNRVSGSGYSLGDEIMLSALTHEKLTSAFMHSPDWAGRQCREATVKWKDMQAFLDSRATVPLKLIRKAHSNS